MLSKAKLQAATELAKIRSKKWGYRYFINEVFSASFGGNFVGGEYIDKVAGHLQNNPWTMDVTGRDHFKSTRLFADIMYAMFVNDGFGFEAHYFSYSKQMAAYQVTKLKEEYIRRNPFFVGLTDHKKQSESVLSYSWPRGYKMTVTPHGLLGGTRGIHGNKIYADDIYKTEPQDEGDVIDPVTIRKINEVMISELMPMVKKDGVFRIVGTPITASDIFFNEGVRRRFKTWITPTILDEKNKVVLWPEWRSYAYLSMLRDAMSIDKFNREYMAMPVSTSNSYIDRDRLLDLCTQENLKFVYHPELENEIVVAGFDVGKKRHPSHLAIWIRTQEGEDEDGRPQYRFKQIYSFWMDHWDYGDQVDYLNQACEFFNVHRLLWDNTSRELEWALESKTLSPVIEPIVFNHANQGKMAAYFGMLVDRSKAEFINETRQYNQILQVSNTLKAAESPEGHGDSFWSNCLALFQDTKPVPRIRSLNDNTSEPSFGQQANPLQTMW